MHAVADDPRYTQFLHTRNGQYPPIDNLEKGCRDLLNNVLEPNPSIRYSSSNIVDNEWFQSIKVCNQLKDENGKSHSHLCKSRMNEWNRLRKSEKITT
jgi:serine/threonine protein kinase